MKVISIPKRVVNDSDASRKADVSMALSWEELTGTSAKDFLIEAKNEPPEVSVVADAIVFSKQDLQEAQLQGKYYGVTPVSEYRGEPKWLTRGTAVRYGPRKCRGVAEVP